MPFVYILTNRSNEVLYVGVTNNLSRRIYEHHSKYTESFSNKYNLMKLVYCESCRSMLDAIRREKQLKAWRRDWKRALVTAQNPHWKDLLS
ncbi:MAG: GIY-YIG nuclease family protein [Elusimicrobiaceae bacterium]|nr:GIY-YIG nuclease family protein [Elusimicrobiaceae bacterium]